MSNLLDKSSIVLTASAYDNGKVLCVKPSDGSGDMDFSRNSAATRVNAQGLVEDVQILSSNLVQNGDFSEQGAEEVSNGSFSQQGSELVTGGDFSNPSDWTKGNGVTISGGKANWTNTINNVGVTQSGIMTSGKNYKVVFTVSNYSSGSVRIRFPSITERITSNGTYTYYINATDTNLYIQGETNGDANVNFSIDNCSVVEVGQDFTFGTGWGVAEDKAVCDGTQTSNSGLVQQGGIKGSTINFVVGKTYKVNFDVVVTSGVITMIEVASGLDFNSITASGNHTTYITAVSTNNRFTILANPSFIGSVTNISVKEVGQNWTLGTGWSIGDNKLVREIAVSGSYAQTSYDLGIIGNNYQISIDVAEVTSGILYVYGGLGGTPAISITSAGVYKINHIWASDQPLGIFCNNSFVGKVNSISVIEITDDTNLPRINYEGFSYQDALGSEEIVNGTFDSNINFWNKGGGNVNPLSWDNGKIKITNDVAQLNSARQTIATEIGKTYKVSADVNSTNGLTPRLASSNPTTGLIGTLGTIETLTYTFIATSTSSQIELFNWQNTIDKYNLWDNVSVKEYLGQEVVPDSGCGSWLWENQSTNLITQSELFSDSYWTKSGASVVSGFISPDGTSNAFKLVSGSGGGNIIARPSLVSNTANTNSIYLKRVSGNGNVSLFNTAGNELVVTLTTEWKRFSVANSTNPSNGYAGVRLYGSGDEVLLFGAQTEQQSYSTSYIPTDGTQKTRNQDVCTNGGSVSTINSTEGVLYAEIARLSDVGTCQLGLFGVSNNEQIRIEFSNSSIRAQLYNGSYQASMSSIQVVTDNNKIAFKYKENDFALWINGIEVGTDNSGVTFNPNELIKFNFTARDVNNLPFFGKTKAVAVFPFLTDTELQELTTI